MCRAHRTFIIVLLVALASISVSAFPTTRDAYLWPFTSTSPWNLPIGSGAVYVSARIQTTTGMGGEIVRENEVIALDPRAPIKTISGTSLLVRVPPSLTADGSWVNCATLLRPDNQTVYSGLPLKLVSLLTKFTTKKSIFYRD